MFLHPRFEDFFVATSPLEQQLIRGFLAEKGYCLEDLETLPEDVAKKLLIDARTFASEKLIEIQTRIQYLQSLSFEEWY